MIGQEEMISMARWAIWPESKPTDGAAGVRVFVDVPDSVTEAEFRGVVRAVNIFPIDYGVSLRGFCVGPEAMWPRHVVEAAGAGKAKEYSWPELRSRVVE